MKLFRIFLATSAAALWLAVATPQARATILPVNTTVTPGLEADPLPGGATILANTLLEPYSAALNGNSIAGTVQEWVVSGYSGNTFGPGALTFVYQVALTSGSTSTGGPNTAILERLTGSGYGSTYLTDAGYNNTNTTFGTGGIIPTTADRSSNGDVVGFNFIPSGPNIMVGQKSALLIVNTNATSYQLATIGIQDGLTANQSGYGPTGAVSTPEPGTIMGALLGAVCVGGHTWLRRRKK